MFCKTIVDVSVTLTYILKWKALCRKKQTFYPYTAQKVLTRTKLNVLLSDANSEANWGMTKRYIQNFLKSYK